MARPVSLLNETQFERSIHFCLTGSHGDVSRLRTATHEALRRLRLKRDPSKAQVRENPETVNFRITTVEDWLSRIVLQDEKTLDKAAAATQRALVDQLLTIDATAVKMTDARTKDEKSKPAA